MRLHALAFAVALAFGGVLGAIAAGGGTAAAQGGSGAAQSGLGSYTITACSPSTSSGAWTSVDQAPASLTAGNLCGNGTPAIGPTGTPTETGALYGEDTIGSTTQVPNGDQAGWQLNAPSGLTITGISYYGSFDTEGDGWLAGLLINGQPLANVCQTNLVETGCDCRTNLDNTSPCQVLNNQAPQVQSDLDASSVFFGVECDQVQGLVSCTPGSLLHDAEADLYSAQVTLTESTQPQVQGEGGGLWVAGPVWGSVPITFTASDPSGIASVDVLDSAGSDVSDTQESCVYSQVQACPELPAGAVNVNTLAIPDGQQQFSLKLTNAAGNTTVVQGPTVILDNNGPPAPGNLTAVAASSSSDVIDLAWSDPTDPPEPVQDAYAQLCQASCANPVQVSASGGAQITAPAAGSYTVRLWLTDTAGRGGPANAATTTVTVPASPTTTTTTTSTTTTTLTTTTATSSTATTTTKTTTRTFTTAPEPSCKPASGCPPFQISSASWSHGHLRLTIAKLPKGDSLQITLHYAHKPTRTITTARAKITIATTRPTRVVLRALKNHRPQGPTITLTRLPAA